MKIDWSKAPEGATHWEPESDGWNSSWMMLSGGGWHWWSSSSEDWMKCPSIKESRVSLMIPRPAAWTGEGLPPAGALCEALIPHHPEPLWVEVTVLAHWTSPQGLIYSWVAERDAFYPPGEFRFRPIRTPEQIASEEALEEIERLYSEGLPPVGAKVILSDANHDVFEPYKEMIGVEVTVVASFASPVGFDMIACALPDGLCGCFRADMARPIRTPEQIAAEERERAIDDLCASIVSHYEARKMSEHYLGLARALHDAGYRKQA